MNLLQATAVASLLFAIPAIAQTQTQTQPTPGMMMQGQGGMGSGMMGQGMMGQGKAGQGMGGSGMMMQGQHGKGPGQQGAGLARGATPDRIEGRLAFLKTELKITEAQTAAWNVFANAMRENARSMGVEHQFMSGRVGTDVSLPDRIQAQVNAFTAHAEEMARFKVALDPLYASFSAEQRKTADEIVFSSMGVPVGMM